MKKSFLAVLLALILSLISVLASCGDEEEGGSGTQSTVGGTTVTTQGGTVSSSTGSTDSSDGESQDDPRVAIYESYVAFMSDKDETPLSYEEWLESIKGADGVDGTTPHIGENGNWYIGELDTGIPATGAQGPQGPQGDKGDQGEPGTNGSDGKDGIDGVDGKDGEDGVTPHIGENGNWYIGELDTGIPATGDKGDQGEPGTNGTNGSDGKDGIDGVDGKDGEDGVTPHIGENGNWYIGELDTGIPATGDKGNQGDKGDKGDQGDKGDKGDQGEQGVGIKEVKYDEDGNLVIEFTDGSKQTVALPEKEEHIHIFTAWTAITTSSAPCDERLFFRLCACNTAEWKQGTDDDHAWNSVVTAPTCQAEGYTTKTCDVCGDVEIVDRTELAPHTWDSVVTAPTCQSEGYTTKTCSVCQEVSVVDITSVAPHPWASTYSFDDTYHWYVCTNCGEKKNETEHTDNGEGVCTACDHLIGPTAGVIYEVIGGVAKVIAYEGTATRVRIAEAYDGAPVTEICQEVFKNSNVTSVLIPDSVTRIGSDAFYGCTSLTSITIPESVTSIGDYVFYNCTSLTEINFNAVAMNDLSSDNYVFYNAGKNGEGIKVTIGKNVTKIPAYLFCPYDFYSSYSPKITSVEFEEGSACTTIGASAFYYCRSLTSITIPDSVTSIGEYVFYYCDSLTSITIPDSVTSIGDYAFYSCTSLTSITIPESVTSIGSGAFSNCSSLQYNIFGNANYLGNKNNPYIVLCGVTNKNYSTYTIHEDTRFIDAKAFENCANMISITIPESVTRIGEFAFEGCTSLTSVTIPDSVTSIGYYAFRYCDSLTIYCEASSKPSGWSSYWNYSGCPVRWGHTHSYTDGECICGVKE